MENLRTGSENQEGCDAEQPLDLTTSDIRSQSRKDKRELPGTGPRSSEAHSSQAQESINHEPQIISVRPKTAAVRSSRAEKPRKSRGPPGRPEGWVPPEQPFCQTMEGPAPGAVAITPLTEDIRDAHCFSSFHSATGGPFENMSCIHVPATKEWQRRVSCGLRTQMMWNFAGALIPYRKIRLNSHCENLQALARISKMIEKTTFETANSWDEYHDTLWARAADLERFLRERSIGERTPSPCRHRLPLHHDPDN
ncbi:uncharacterized protein [Palaemon carinicauda]|uniref:uncharacterized protein n=1 Tax=Palaemon carinicauda TaxID=392227 RepID=UPI0035B663DF